MTYRPQEIIVTIRIEDGRRRDPHPEPLPLLPSPASTILDDLNRIQREHRQREKAR
jgi:hypothetical protein